MKISIFWALLKSFFYEEAKIEYIELNWIENMEKSWSKPDLPYYLQRKRFFFICSLYVERMAESVCIESYIIHKAARKLTPFCDLRTQSSLEESVRDVEGV